MSKIVILNGAQPHGFALGRLNATLAERVRDRLIAQGHDVRLTSVAEGYDVAVEVENHIWADTVILQFPVNWMDAPWAFKKHMDEVYTAGMGGKLTGTGYMISDTFNAPREAFDDPAEPFFEGMSMDDLLRPVHLNAKFFGMSPLPSFGSFDVMKDPPVKADLRRFDAHLDDIFTEADHVAA